MDSKVISFVLIALALVGGTVAIRQFTTNNQQSIAELAAVASMKYKNTLADIERQLGYAQKSGSISPSSYRSIDAKLKGLEKNKIDTSKARVLFKKLEVGGQSSSVQNSRTDDRPSGRGIEEATAKKATGVKGYWQEWKTGYEPVGSIPPCPNPLVIPSPVDLSLVTAILYPGQYRGGNYKAHGGFRLDNQSNNEVTVRIPLDAELIYGSRYYQSGEVQYMFGFRMPCGIEYRLDHLKTLAPKFQAIVEASLPLPKVNDSRTTPFSPPPSVRAGEVIATEVGFANPLNVSFDFGVYDLRQKNKKASDLVWMEARKDNSLAPYAVCWFDWLSPEDRARVRALPAADWKSGAQSDYCE